MAHQLADETLADILAYSLHVPEEDFASLAELSKAPFVNRQTSSSAALAVCKRWMRVGTPLLYNTAIMRSTAQADALARALKANPPFAPYLKKLRIEGGFGVSVRKILEMAPEITDIWLMLDYTSDEKVKPMCAGLEKVANVRRLILYRLQYVSFANNANTRLILSTVLDCIKSWAKLRVVRAAARTIVLHAGLRAALLQANQLEELYFSEACLDLAPFVSECPANIKRIHVDWVDPGDGCFLPVSPYARRDTGRLARTHMARLVFATPVKAASIPPPENPFYKPMNYTPPDVRQKIWSRVFEILVADCPRLEDYDYATERYRPVKECTLVSSEFREVMMEVACQQAYLHGVRATESFALLLKNRPHLASLVKGVQFNVSRSISWDGHRNGEMCFNQLGALMPKLVNLRSFRTVWNDYPLDLKQFACLTPVSEMLRELKVHLRPAQPEYQYYSNIISRPFELALPVFASLKTLSLMLDRSSTLHLKPPPPHALNALNSLDLHGPGCAEFLRMIRPLQLESLRILGAGVGN